MADHLAARPSVPDPAVILPASPVLAADVARGVARMLLRHDYTALTEVPLGNGRRADIMAINSRGQILIVEIKVSRADLLGDGKWPEYLDYCDHFCWAVPAGFPLDPFDAPAFRPELAGLIVADRYDAQYWREGAVQPMPPARRRAETLRFARRAARRLIAHLDPDAGQI